MKKMRPSALLQGCQHQNLQVLNIILFVVGCNTSNHVPNRLYTWTIGCLLFQTYYSKYLGEILEMVGGHL
jgi:hypothetical protein